jgi:transposase
MRDRAPRLAFCQKMLKILEDLPKIHLSDGLKVVLGADRQWIWFRSGEDNPGASASSIKFPPTVMVFAIIGIGFKSDLMLREGSIDTDRNIHNLDCFGFLEALDAMHGLFGWIFQQHGALEHILQWAPNWLEESIDVIIDWPANSLDLSPIEALWAILKKLVERINPQRIEDLKAALIAAWALIRQTSIDRLCQGFQSRLERCLIEEGNSISNQLWRISERAAMKDFLEGNHIYIQ